MPGVTQTNSYNTHNADGVTTVFPFTFFAYSSSNIKVYTVEAPAAPVDVTNLATITLNTNFLGGSVDFGLNVFDAPKKILIRRQVPYTQQAEFADLTRYKESAIEVALNALCLQIQQIKDAAGLSVKFLETAGITEGYISQAIDGKALIFSGTDGLLVPGPDAADITQANGYALAAQQYRDEAEDFALAAAGAGKYWAGTFGGSANSLTATIANFSLQPGVEVSGIASAANTGSTDLNINGGGGVTVKKRGNATNLVAGDIVGAGYIATFRWNGTSWVMQNPGNATTLDTTLGTNVGGTGATTPAGARTNLQIDGEFLTAQTNTFSIAVANHGKVYRVDTTAGIITAGVPLANTMPNGGYVYIQKSAGPTGHLNRIRVQRNGSDTINGATSVDIYDDNAIYKLVSDGVSAWKLFKVGFQPESTPQEDVLVEWSTITAGQNGFFINNNGNGWDPAYKQIRVKLRNIIPNTTDRMPIFQFKIGGVVVVANYYWWASVGHNGAGGLYGSNNSADSAMNLFDYTASWAIHNAATHSGEFEVEIVDPSSTTRHKWLEARRGTWRRTDGSYITSIKGMGACPSTGAVQDMYILLDSADTFQAGGQFKVLGIR